MDLIVILIVVYLILIITGTIIISNSHYTMTPFDKKDEQDYYDGLFYN